jgi:hypothetical protein
MSTCTVPLCAARPATGGTTRRARTRSCCRRRRNSRSGRGDRLERHRRELCDRLLTDVVHHRLGRDDRALSHEQRNITPVLAVARSGRAGRPVDLAAEPVGPAAGGQVDVLCRSGPVRPLATPAGIAEHPCIDIVAHLGSCGQSNISGRTRPTPSCTARVFVAVDIRDQRIAQRIASVAAFSAIAAVASTAGVSRRSRHARGRSA